MTAPLTRDQQIELMRTAKNRHRAGMAARLSDVAVRKTVCRPTKRQLELSSYSTSSKEMACCG